MLIKLSAVVLVTVEGVSETSEIRSILNWR